MPVPVPPPAPPPIVDVLPAKDFSQSVPPTAALPSTAQQSTHLSSTDLSSTAQQSTELPSADLPLAAQQSTVPVVSTLVSESTGVSAAPHSFFAARAEARAARRLRTGALPQVAPEWDNRQATSPSDAIALQTPSRSGAVSQPPVRAVVLGEPLTVGRSPNSPSPSYLLPVTPLPSTGIAPAAIAPRAIVASEIVPAASRLDNSTDRLGSSDVSRFSAEPLFSSRGRSLTEAQQQAAQAIQQRFDRLTVTQNPLPVLDPLIEPRGLQGPLQIRPIPVFQPPDSLPDGLQENPVPSTPILTPFPEDSAPTDSFPTESFPTESFPAESFPAESFPTDPSPTDLPTFPSSDDTPLNPDRQILTIPPLDDTSPASPPSTEQSPAPVDPAPSAVPDPNALPDGVSGDGITGDGVAEQQNPVGTGEILEVDADRQEFDTLREVFQADGRVEMRFREAVLTADRLRVNLPNRIAVADGNVVLTRGAQVLRGDRLEYSFVQSQGTVFNARGEVFLPTSSDDLTILPTPTDEDPSDPSDPTTPPPAVPLPPTYSPGGIQVDFGTRLDQGVQLTADKVGELTRFRFEAEQIDFSADGWVARNVALTNDPFSPPELILRTRQLTYRRLNPFQAELRARNPRLVFDGGLNLPLLRDRILIDSRRRNANPIQFAFDDQVGGLYVQRAFEIVNTPQALITLSPALLIQRALTENGGNFFDPSSFGLVGSLDLKFNPNTSLLGTAIFTSLDLADLEETFRGSLRLRQRVNLGGINHRLSLEYSYRDRLFNGSLGYQNVQSSLGAVFSSPNIALGTSGININYQASAQIINADTDREELLDPILERTNNRATLGRFQATVGVSRGFLLWSGTPLPATPEEGLRYTPNPLVPYVVVVAIARGTISHYTNDETQASLTGTVVLQGQFGHFSRDFLDYTAFNVSYTQAAINGESPYSFDRIADPQVLSFGLVQQIYGPFRAGFQSSINLDNNQGFDTDFILEYSRRTYAIILRYNPDREVGSLGIRISDFNWGSPPEPFSGVLDERVEGNTVQGGVQPAGN